MMAGTMNDGRRTCLSHMFEAVGSYYAGKLGRGGPGGVREQRLPHLRLLLRHVHRQLHELPHEAIGMGLRGNGNHPRRVVRPAPPGQARGMQIMELVEKNIRPRDIMTEAAFHNAETVDMALGCSTNTMLHLPAIAHECGIELSFDMANEIL